MAAKSSSGGFVVATVTNPGSFMATITHPTGNGYCRDRILRDRTGSGYISTCHIKDPLTVFTHPLHIIIAMSYNAPLTVIGPPSHIIIAVPYNGQPPYVLSLQCHIMDPPDHFWTPLHIITAVSYNGPLDCYLDPLTYYHCSVI